MHVIGTDEVGRGALCGPVIAAAVYLPADHGIVGIKDSKKLSAASRAYLCEKLINTVPCAWHAVDNKVIDEINILNATLMAMKLAVEKLIFKLKFVPDRLIIDGDKLLPGYAMTEQVAIPKADNLYEVVSAASIVAKHIRDSLMIEMATVYPGYGIEQHKGYGTALHKQKIAELGPTPIHRKTFGGVKEYI